MIRTDAASGRIAVTHPRVDLLGAYGGSRDEQPPVRNDPVARSSRATPRRLTSSVEIVRVRGPDAAHLAGIHAEAIKEVLRWALEQHSQHEQNEKHIEDRAA
jgi:hypothetical protein